MDRVSRNLAIILFGLVGSALTAAVLVFFEGRSGQALFGYALWTYVPLGAVGAGFVGGIGYLIGAQMVNFRPARGVLVAVVVVAAGTVYLIQSAEINLMMAGPGATADVATYSHFLANSVVHSPLQFKSGGGSSDDASSASNGAVSAPHISSDTSASAQNIGGSVSGMLATQNVAQKVTSGNQISRLTDGIQSIGSGVQIHGAAWVLAGLQIAGFALGGLLIVSQVRSLSYCKKCMLLLSKKGSQTRYFDRSLDIRTSVDEVLAKAKNRQLKESVKAHVEKGSGKRGKNTAFSSTIEVEHCKGCLTNRVNYRAMRKDGVGWKDIAAMAYTASTMESIKVG